jgi:hypothetical protein
MFRVIVFTNLTNKIALKKESLQQKKEQLTMSFPTFYLAEKKDFYNK